MSAAISNGPRYALALYDGDRLMGFIPQIGDSMVRKPDGFGIDLFHSELGVRSQARRLAIKFAPLTVAPFDLNENRPLDPFVNSEEDPMHLKDEETRDLVASRLSKMDETRTTVDSPGLAIQDTNAGNDNLLPYAMVNPTDGLHAKAERAEAQQAIRKLVKTHHILAKLLDRFFILT